MKSKLTLTVQKEITEKAKKVAEEKGMSLSKLFEQVFESNDLKPLKSPEQLAISKLKKKLGKIQSKPVADQNSDKENYRRHLSQKYA